MKLSDFRNKGKSRNVFIKIMKMNLYYLLLSYRVLFVQREALLRKEIDQACYEVLHVHPQLPSEISITIAFLERIFFLKDEKNQEIWSFKNKALK